MRYLLSSISTLQQKLFPLCFFALMHLVQHLKLLQFNLPQFVIVSKKHLLLMFIVLSQRVLYFGFLQMEPLHPQTLGLLQEILLRARLPLKPLLVLGKIGKSTQAASILNLCPI